MDHMLGLWAGSILLVLGYVLLCKFRPRPRSSQDLTLMVILGSGGHTTEMLTLLKSIPLNQYKRSIFVMAETDRFSAQKVTQLYSHEQIMTIPRSREVGQSWSSTVISTLISSVKCGLLLGRTRPHVILCNGPGTCIPMCGVAWIFNQLLICQTVMFYVESICRVRSLSFSGKIMQFLTPHVLVQWPELTRTAPRTKYIARFV
ncbi:UDP-N-acetylglucosamine transferase subunit ALG14 homolog [Tigriopus californicus]|nr:UDP-N-acetylglucosamine transferase subunit ALG14 homolog [Tigriopus californicus]